MQQLEEISFPTFDTWPDNPGEYFANGGMQHASTWNNLKSIVLPYYLGLGTLRRFFTELPFWNNLRKLSFGLTHQQREALDLLSTRLPPSLREIELSVGISPNDLTGNEVFFERLAQLPIQRLSIRNIAIAATTLRRLLGASRMNLTELRLEDCNLTHEHTRVLVECPGVETIRTLGLSGNWHLGDDGASILFNAERLGALQRLDLRGTNIGSNCLRSLASSSLKRLQSLDVLDTRLTAEGLRALLISPNCEQLTHLAVGGYGGRDPITGKPRPRFELNAELATNLTQVPNLANLWIRVSTCDQKTRQILARNPSAWTIVLIDDDDDIQTYRATKSPERWPPLDGYDCWAFGY